MPAASDEELVDAPDVNEDADAANTADDPEENPDVNPNRDAEPESEAEPKQESDAPQEPDAAAAEPKAEGEPDTDAAATPAAGSETPAEPETPRTVGRTSAIPRKRRAGRPPKNRPPDWDLVDEVGSERPSVSTPSKRRRGRPSAGGGRWGRRGGQSNTPTKVVVDKDGTTLDVVDDEVVVPEDPAGEKKVDKNGYLQGGREYRVRTFTLLGRGERLYMLSTEPARCVGFRDSYLFFQKHKHLFKIIIDDEAKRDLIEREIIPHSYKGRAIGVVTARSVFREFGAKIIIGGRKVIDDYHEQAARERGDVEGELAVPEDKLPPPGEPYNRNQFVAWHGASSVYHTNAPSGPLPGGRAGESGKRRIAVTGDNWMVEHAREARYVFHSNYVRGVLRANWQPQSLQLCHRSPAPCKPGWRVRSTYKYNPISKDHAAHARTLGAPPVIGIADDQEAHRGHVITAAVERHPDRRPRRTEEATTQEHHLPSRTPGTRATLRRCRHRL